MPLWNLDSLELHHSVVKCLAWFDSFAVYSIPRWYFSGLRSFAVLFLVESSSLLSMVMTFRWSTQVNCHLAAELSVQNLLVVRLDTG